MEFVYVASFLFCCLPLMVTGQDSAVKLELRILQVKDNEVYIAELGDNKMLTCQATTTGEVGDQQPDLKWFYEGNLITSTSRSDRVHTSPSTGGLKLFIKTVVDEDGGTYRCDGSLAGQQDSKSVTVEVHKKPEFLSKLKQFGIFGLDGKVECKVSGKPTPRIYWKFENEDDIPNNDKYVKESDYLTIKSLTLDDAKTYLCYIEVTSTGDVDYQFIEYTVSKPPKIDNVVEIQPLNPKEGDNVKLTCRAEGIPKPNIYFMKESNRVDDSMVSDGVLTISSLKHEDEANYFCFATNVGGRANKSIHLDVKIPPRVTITMLNQGEAGDPVEGQMVSVKCEAEGDPQPSIKWKKESMASYYEDGLSADEGPRFESGGGTDRQDAEIKTVSKTMIFDSIRHQDAGKYICLASNVIADVQEETSISIKYPPDFNTDYKVREFYGWKGHRANLTCQSTANPTPIYRWYHSQPDNPEVAGEEISTGGVFTVATQQNWDEYKLSSSSLMIDMTVREDLYGTYICEASNSLAEGRKSIAVTLKQANTPGLPEVTMGSPLTTMVKLTIRPPSVSGGQPVYSYQYDYFPDGDRNGAKSGSVDREGEETSVEITKLKMNTKYVVHVNARNNVGLGQATIVSFSTKDRSKPLPLLLQSNKEGDADTSYTLSWADPEDGEDAITEFIIKYAKVEVADETADVWDFERILGEEKTETVQSATIKQYTIKNLERDSYYQVKVSAMNSVGTSDETTLVFKTSKGTGRIGDSSSTLAGNLATLALSFLLACLTTL